MHYKATYDNISAAVADNQTDSLAVVGILIKEDTVWNQYHKVKGGNSINSGQNWGKFSAGANCASPQYSMAL